MKTETDLELELVKVGSPRDFRLAELLGENALDCLVLYFDGKEAPWVGGTPPNTLNNRLARMQAVETLNKHGKQWQQFFPEWARMFRDKLGLPADVTADTYKPVISLKIHRVVAGYSSHASAAMTLFEMLGNRLKTWDLSMTTAEDLSAAVYRCHLVSREGKAYCETGESQPAVIAEAFVKLLES